MVWWILFGVVYLIGGTITAMSTAWLSMYSKYANLYTILSFIFWWLILGYLLVKSIAELILGRGG